MREVEHRKVSKLILKSSAAGVHLHEQQDDFFRHLDAMNENYQDKANSLLRFTRKYKKEVKVNSHKLDYVDEVGRLEGIAKKLELSVRTDLHTAAAMTPEIEDLGDILDRCQGYENARKRNQKEIVEQLHHVKQMMHESLKKTKAVASTRGAMEVAEQSTGGPGLSSLSIYSIIAELFLQLRTDQSAVWQYLRRQDNSLTADVKASSSTIFNTIWSSQLTLQNKEFVDQLETVRQKALMDFRSRFSPEQVDDASAGDGAEVHQHLSGTVGGRVSLGALETEFRLQLDVMISAWMDEINRLDSEQQQRSGDREEEKAAVCAEFSLEVSDSCGGWTEDDHKTFVKICNRSSVKGLLRNKMLEQLQQQLPHISLDSIVAHEEWFRKVKQLAERHREATQQYTSRRMELLTQSTKDIEKQCKDLLDSYQHEQLVSLHEQHRLEVHTRLRELRAVKELQDKEYSEAQSREEQILLQELSVKEELLQQERQQRKAEVDRYQRSKLELRQQQMQQLEAQREQSQKELRSLIEANRSKIQRRYELLQEKEVRRRDKEVTCLLLVLVMHDSTTTLMPARICLSVGRAPSRGDAAT